jgi:hypothetical protein
MEARDIFGDEPDTDEISEAPSMERLASAIADFNEEHGVTGLDLGGEVVTNQQLRQLSKVRNPATERQANYIVDLLETKELPEELEKKKPHYLAMLDAEALDKTEASQLISQLVGFKRKEGSGEYAFVKPTVEELPAGRYAVIKDGDENEVRFYQVWRGTKYGKPDLIKVYVQHGPDDSELPCRTAMVICKLIIHQGVLECAQRYGREIGSCYRCGHRLTNRISRKLGIGPICGNRDFGDRFKGLEEIARAEIIREGFDPDEVIEIDSE